MQFSGKITNSVLAYLARKGWDRERLFELTDVPLEFLRDPTSWIDASAVESFLCAVEAESSQDHPHLLRDVGWASVDLRGWGVLDSVLKMMQKPQDIFSQPQRFISYFISPAPPILNLKTQEDSVSFDLPMAHNEYPATVAYLTSAFEGLAKYWGQEVSQATWKNTTVQVFWSIAQSPLLEEPLKNPKPELVESLVRGVEMAQAQVETRDLEIARLEQEVRELQLQLQKVKTPFKVTLERAMEGQERQLLRQMFFEIRENVLRMSDYLTRSQQALTMARMAHRQDPQVSAVLKRIDWETIRTQYPWLQMQIVEGLNAADNLLDPQQPKTLPHFPSPLGARLSMEQILAEVVERDGRTSADHAKITVKNFVLESASFESEKVKLILIQMISAAERLVGKKGELDLAVRVRESFLDLDLRFRIENLSREIDNDLPLLRNESFGPRFELEKVTEFIQQQNGHLSSKELPGNIHQWVCEWPLFAAKDVQHGQNSKSISP